MPGLARGSENIAAGAGKIMPGRASHYAGSPEFAGSRDPSRSGNVIAADCQGGAPGQVGRQTAWLGSKDLPVGGRVALE
jgi:hypothetical protein